MRTLAYTNHTLLPEALEKWPVDCVRADHPAAPRNHLRDQSALSGRRPRALSRRRRTRAADEPDRRDARPAGPHGQPGRSSAAHSTNGVAAIHSQLLRTRTVRDFAEMFPERFNNKTNGVTPRRWLQMCNPALAAAHHRSDRRRLDHRPGPAAQAVAARRAIATFRGRVREAKRQAKGRFADWLKATTGQIVDPDTIFDCQIKRIHEYKRQLLNALHVDRALQPPARRIPKLELPPRTCLLRRQGGPRLRSSPS